MTPLSSQHSGLRLDWNFVRNNTKEETYLSPFDIIKWTEIREVRDSGIQEMTKILSYGYNPDLAPVYVKRESDSTTTYLCIDGMHRVEVMKHFWSLPSHPLKGKKLRVVVLEDYVTEHQCIAIAIMINRSNGNFVPTTLYDKICEFERIKQLLEKDNRANRRITFTDVAFARFQSSGRSDFIPDSDLNGCRKAASIALRISEMERTRQAIKTICDSSSTRNTLTFLALAKVLGEKSLKRNDIKSSYATRALVSSASRGNGEFDHLSEETAKLRLSRFPRAWKYIEILGKYLGESTTRTGALLFDSDWPDEIKNEAYNFIVNVLRGGKPFNIIYGLPAGIVSAIKRIYPGHEELLDRCYRDVSEDLRSRSTKRSGQTKSPQLPEQSGPSCDSITGSHHLAASNPSDLSAAEAMQDLASARCEKRNLPDSPRTMEHQEREIISRDTTVESEEDNGDGKNREGVETAARQSFELGEKDRTKERSHTSSEGTPPRKLPKYQNKEKQSNKIDSGRAAERPTSNLGDSCLCLNASFQKSLANIQTWVNLMYRTSPAVDLMIFGPPEGASHDGPIVGYELTEFANALCSPGASILVITSSSAVGNEWQRIFSSSPYFEPEQELSILIEDQRKYLHCNTERIITTRFMTVARRSGVTLRAQRRTGTVQLDGFGQQSMNIPNRYLALSNVISGCPPLSKAENLTDQRRKVSIENQIPVSILKELVLRYSSAGQIVCDPFSGSFATAKACVITGRLFVGCERSKTVFCEGFRSLNEAHSDIFTHKRNIWIRKWISGSTNHPSWVREASTFAEKLRNDCHVTGTRVEQSIILDDPDEKALFTNETREPGDVIAYYYGRYVAENLLDDDEKSYDFTKAELDRKIKIRSVALLSNEERVRRQIKEHGNLVLVGSPICAATYANSMRNGKQNAEIREWPDYNRTEFDQALEDVGENVFFDPKFLALFATKRILPTEEITFDYGYNF